MKKTLIITTAILLIAGCKTGKIGKYKPIGHFKGDTIKFLQKSILDRKAYYIGKELDVFLNDLNIPIVNNTTIRTNKKFISPGVYLQIYSKTEQNLRKKNNIDPINFIVTWTQPMLIAKSDSVRKKDNDLPWATNAKEFYGKQIIGDLNLSKFKNSKLHDEKLTNDKTKIPKYKPLNKFNGDTLSFLNKSILGRAEYYEGKKVSVFIKDLKIPLKDVLKGFIASPHQESSGMNIEIFTGFEKKYNPKRDFSIKIVLKDHQGQHPQDGKQEADIAIYKNKIIKSIFLSDSTDKNYFKNLEFK
jgi:hypothetical protein